MKKGEFYKVSDYDEAICLANNEEKLLFERYGYYEGEWILITKTKKPDEGFIKIYKDYFGSCSGCDSFEANFDYGSLYDSSAINDFARDYPPFISIPISTFKYLVANNSLPELFPKNVRGIWNDLDYADVVEKLKGIEITEEETT